MRVAFCVLKNLTYGGGMETYTLQVGRRLVQRGHEVRVYCMKHYGPVPPELHGMRLIGVPCLGLRPLEKISAAATAAARTLLDDPCDIVHFQHVGAGWASGLVHMSGGRTVLQLHGLAWRTPQWGSLGGRFLRVLEGLAVRQCDAVTCLADAQAEYLRQRYRVNAVCIPCGVDSAQPAEPMEIRSLGLSHRSYVLYVGRLSVEKGPHLLVEAFRKVKTDCRLVLAGPQCDASYTRRLQELARGDDRILFTGMVAGRLLRELYSNAAVYVQPSLLEGMSLALLEAMSYRNVCLVSDIPENLETIGRLGWTFRSGEPADLAKCLDRLLASQDQARSVGRQAEEYVKRTCNWDRITDQLENLYASVLTRQAAA